MPSLAALCTLSYYLSQSKLQKLLSQFCYKSGVKAGQTRLAKYGLEMQCLRHREPGRATQTAVAVPVYHNNRIIVR